MIKLIFTVLDDTIGSLRLHLLGHELVLDWRPAAHEDWCVIKSILPVDQAVVRHLSDRALATRNLVWLPDEIERQLYDNIYTLVLGLLNEIVGSASLSVGGNLYLFDLEPNAPGGPEQSASASLTAPGCVDEAAAAEAALAALRLKEAALLKSHHAALVALRCEKAELKRRLRER